MSKAWEPDALHILDAIAKIRLIGKRGDICTDEILYDAVLRNLQTLSEATQRLPAEVKLNHPAIPWKEISGFRNILVHYYLGSIDPAVIKRVIEERIPELEAAIRKILGSD